MSGTWDGEERRAGWSNNPNQLLTEAQAARLLQVQPNTLAKWRCGKGGKGPAFTKAGKAIRYRRDKLDEFIARNTFSNNAEARHKTNEHR